MQFTSGLPKTDAVLQVSPPKGRCRTVISGTTRHARYAFAGELALVGVESKSGDASLNHYQRDSMSCLHVHANVTGRRLPFPTTTGGACGGGDAMVLPSFLAFRKKFPAARINPDGYEERRQGNRGLVHRGKVKHTSGEVREPFFDATETRY